MQSNDRGFVLIDLLVYIASAVAILAAITYFAAQMYTVYSAVTAPARADRVGASALAALAKDIRSGRTVNQAASAFNTPAGFLTIEAQTGETELVKHFGIENGRLVYRENGGSAIHLTPEDMAVSALRFTQLVTPISYAVRYELTLTFPVRGGTETRTYSGLAIMRHSYE